VDRANNLSCKKQYREDRDPKEPLFQFGRCLVHFAVDPDEAYMTTKIDGNSTYFLPFNKGCNHGKGNDINPTGHKTAYIWEEVLTRNSLTNIIEHFAKLVEEEDSETGKVRKILYFPRYHQLDVVRKVLSDVRKNGVGKKYLIQHSAGSGKSNSITWLGYQLIELYNTEGKQNVFDSVIVVTDRRILDKQLKDNIKSFSEVKNIVAHAYNSQELKSALENGKKLIITTIQKFPFIVDGIEDLSDRKFAVIVDEAHSSQSGSSADKLNSVISAPDGEEVPEDLQDIILEAMNKRKMGDNSSFFAFTATPKNATLEKFGTKREDGKFYPFHLYSMKQAIEEGFILDVLANYTTYRSYYEVQKSTEDNPLFDTKKAQKKLRTFVEAHPDTIEVKSGIIIDHFMSSVWQAKKMKGKAKAMVVTRNIESAIRYFMAIRKF
jgi:type I restriction enzyme R subunit